MGNPASGVFVKTIGMAQLVAADGCVKHIAIQWPPPPAVYTSLAFPLQVAESQVIDAYEILPMKRKYQLIRHSSTYEALYQEVKE